MECITTAGPNVKRQSWELTDHFKRLLEEACLNHTYPANLSPGPRLAAVGNMRTQGCKGTSFSYIHIYISMCMYVYLYSEKKKGKKIGRMARGHGSGS
jgi:hypothetical protein